jgi:hypothetical protein
MPATTTSRDVEDRVQLLMEAEGASRRTGELLDEAHRKAAAAAELFENPDALTSRLRKAGVAHDEIAELRRRAGVLASSLEAVDVDDINIAAWSAHEFRMKLQELREAAMRELRERDDG